MALTPASFSAAEDMRMLQRAFFAAQTLGIADKAHQSIFDAAWKTCELAVVDTILCLEQSLDIYRRSITDTSKSHLPTLEDAARCYGRITGVKPEEFLRSARDLAVRYGLTFTFPASCAGL
ncbi:MAG: hypothetical protein ACJ8R9_02270 [Steroidobacteraceae bacterium]